MKVGGIYAKLECVNPTGSVKDRMVKFILDESERLGLLRKGMTIVEATSGNTGIALSYFGKQMGYRVKIIMPDNMTQERKDLIRSYGAELILCPPADGFLEALRIRDTIAKGGHCFTTDQFSNPLNSECHYRTTGQEIIRQLSAESETADAFAAGVGTGGTLMGIAKALRDSNPRVHVAAVEPAESPVMSGGRPGLHNIGGIGDGFVPGLVKDPDGRLSGLVNEVIQVTSEDAVAESKWLARHYGFCVGVSSGANFLAAQKLVTRYRTVVTVFPDSFTRYLTLGLQSSGACGFHGPACQRHSELTARLRGDSGVVEQGSNANG